MRSKGRIRPERLAEKLLQIREALGLSQPEMLKHLGVEDLIVYNHRTRLSVRTNYPTCRPKDW